MSPTKKPFCELSHLSQQMAMKGTSAGTSADVCVCLCVCMTVSQMKKDGIEKRVLIVSKQGRCVGPGEEEYVGARV